MKKLAFFLAIATLASMFGCGKIENSDTSDTVITTSLSEILSSADTTVSTTPETTTVPTAEPLTEQVVYTGVPEEPSDGYPIKSLKLAGNDISLYKVILPSDAIPSEQTAAAELIKYIERATGVTLETADDAEYAIILRGETGGELGEEGFQIAFEGSDLVITGGRTRGVLYGIYTFLEDYVGCRFYTANCELIHKADLIDVSADTNDKQLPVFETRYSFWYDFLRSENLKAKLKVNHSVTSEALGGGVDFTGGLVHTFVHFISAGAYEAEHPEYFNGSRQLCITNPEVLEIAIAYVRELLAQNPDAKIISISQNDNEDYCKCEACMAIAEEEGSMMGPLLRFVNAIARNIAEDYPDVLIDTLAYRYTRKAPLITKPEPNVQIRLCSIECSFSHQLDDPDCALNVAFMDDLKAWAAITDHLAVWDYTTNFANYNAPFPNFDVLRENARIFAEYGVDYLFEQGTYDYPSGEFGELKGYLIAKLIWNPYMTEDEYNALMDGFLEDYYGAGWENIRAYINFMIERSTVSDLTIYEDTQRYIQSEEWPQVNAWWDTAKSMATALQLEHLEKSYTSVLYQKLKYYTYYLTDIKNPWEQYFAVKELYAQYKVRFGLAEREGGY